MPVAGEPASRRATRAPDNAAKPELLERAMRLAKREGASAVRITRRGSIVIELLPSTHGRARHGPAACGATPTSASTGAGAASAPRRRQGGSASRRARSAARLRDYVDAKKVHEKRRLILLRLRDYLHRALGQIRRERMQGDNGRRVGGAKRAADELTAPPDAATVPRLGGPSGAAGQPLPAAPPDSISKRTRSASAPSDGGAGCYSLARQ